MMNITGFVRPVYDRTIRPLLPRKVRLYNGVGVRAGRFLDIQEIESDYEAALVSGIRNSVRSDDSVIVIGGGYGVSTVVAAHQAGPQGDLLVFEGADDRVEILRETVEMNCVPATVEIRHANVGEFADPDDAYGEATTETVPPQDLPKADVLVMDCEGAEREIVERLSHEPDQIIVETHGAWGSPTEEMKQLLENRGYQVEEVGVEDADQDVKVLRGTRA